MQGSAASQRANQEEDRIGSIAMRVEFASGQCDDARRSQRAEALTRWLLDEWMHERERMEAA